jgi:hypothetical protein
MPTTPNMGMSLPTVSTTVGPTWATNLNDALTTIVDPHDHTSGKGVQIPTAGINIDDDLAFNNNDATLLRSVRLSEQSAALSAATDLGCICNVGGDFYWINGDGTAVQITDGGSLSATSLGGISGLPSGTASAAFAAATFTWRSATNQAATMDVGPVVIRDTAASALGITLQSPTGLAGAYALTLPSALPGATSFMRLTSAGVMAADVAPDASTIEVSGSSLRVKDLGISTAKIASGAVTRAKLESVGQMVSSSVNATVTATTWAAVTGLTVSITTTGRPVMIFLQPDDSASLCAIQLTCGATAPTFCYGDLRIAVTGSATTNLCTLELGGYFTAATEERKWPVSSVMTLYVAAAGTYTFQVQAQRDDSNTTFTIGPCKLVAYEL